MAQSIIRLKPNRTFVEETEEKKKKKKLFLQVLSAIQVRCSILILFFFLYNFTLYTTFLY